MHNSILKWKFLLAHKKEISITFLKEALDHMQKL